jgi:hypothetical protein
MNCKFCNGNNAKLRSDKDDSLGRLLTFLGKPCFYGVECPDCHWKTELNTNREKILNNWNIPFVSFEDLSENDKRLIEGFSSEIAVDDREY